MYTMFDENVSVEDIPARVSAGGGYQALADAHVRFPRSELAEGEGNDRTPKPSKLKTKYSEDHNDRDGEQSKPTRGKAKSDEGDEAEESPPKVTLLATFEEDGQSFLDLPLPCYATVVMHISAGPGGSRAVRIFHAEHAE